MGMGFFVFYLFILLAWGLHEGGCRGGGMVANGGLFFIIAVSDVLSCCEGGGRVFYYRGTEMK